MIGYDRIADMKWAIGGKPKFLSLSPSFVSLSLLSLFQHTFCSPFTCFGPTICTNNLYQPRQLYKNWRNSSATGLSGEFLADWLAGDITNLVGCILTKQVPTQVSVMPSRAQYTLLPDLGALPARWSLVFCFYPIFFGVGFHLKLVWCC